MRKLALSALVALLVVAALPVAAAPAFPEVIPLPNDFGAEGVTVGRGGTFYAGSLNDGSVLAGDLSGDDGNPSVFTGQAEICDLVDNDCDDAVDEPEVCGGMACTVHARSGRGPLAAAALVLCLGVLVAGRRSPVPELRSADGTQSRSFWNS